MSQRRRPGDVPETGRGLDRLRRLDPAARLWIGAGALFLVVLGLIAAGLYSRYYVPPRETVLTVGERDYKMSYFVERLRYYLIESAIAGSSISAVDAPNAVLTRMEQEAILLASADAEGLNATEAEVEQKLRENVARLSGADQEVPVVTATPAAAPADATAEASQSPEATPSPLPTPSPFAFGTDKDYQDALKKVRDRTGLSEEQLREIAHAEVLRDGLREEPATQLPTVALQSQLDVIFVLDTATAEGAKARLDAEEPFVQVQADVSPETLPPPIGTPAPDTPAGEVPREEPDWVIKEMLLGPFQEPVFSIPVGTYTDIIVTDRGSAIVKVRSREERALEDTQREFLLADAIENWFEVKRGTITVQRLLDSEKTAWALDRVG